MVLWYFVNTFKYVFFGFEKEKDDRNKGCECSIYYCKIGNHEIVIFICFFLLDCNRDTIEGLEFYLTQNSILLEERIRRPIVTLMT